MSVKVLTTCEITDGGGDAVRIVDESGEFLSVRVANPGPVNLEPADVHALIDFLREWLSRDHADD